MTRRKKVLLLAIAGAVVLAGLLVIGGLAVTGRWVAQQAKTAPDSTPLTESDKRLLLTAADLGRLGGPAGDPDAENWSSLRQGGGNRFILYRYEPKSEPRISIYSRLALLPHPDAARRMYQMDKVMLKLPREDETYVPAPVLFPGGGDRSAWFIEKDGETIGNFFLIREGRLLQSAKLTGLALHEPADVQNLLGPMLTESRRRTMVLRRSAGWVGVACELRVAGCARPCSGSSRSCSGEARPCFLETSVVFSRNIAVFSQNIVVFCPNVVVFPRNTAMFSRNTVVFPRNM